MNLKELEARERALDVQTAKTLAEMKEISLESKRITGLAANAHGIIKDLDREFESITKLSKTDIAFLFVAVGLQILRQYLLTQFPERQDDAVAARETKGHTEEHSNRSHRYYNPSLEEILTNPVPFDANIGANGALSGGGKMGHRVTALGHDPIIGLIVGTSNIATSTLTNNRLESFHIYTAATGIGNRDVFRNRANTAMVFEKTGEKLIDGGLRGKEIVGMSLAKEIIHLKSDVNTKHSLPLPFISVISAPMASKLAEYGLDMANVTTVVKQATISALINTLIAMVHGAFMPEELHKELYEVRTRRILAYSNIIASTSNLIFIGAAAKQGDEKMLKKLDVGGLLVTCYRVATDTKFMTAVKQEFIERKFFEMIQGDCV